MGGLQLEANEKLLAEGEAMDLRGPLAVQGQLILTNLRLHFIPSKLNARFGMKAWGLWLSDVEETALGGIDRMLKVTTPGRSVRLKGKTARDIHELLVRRREHARLAKGAEGTGDDDWSLEERLLLSGQIEVYRNDLMTVSGELHLTSRRLRFSPRAVERLIWKNLEFDIAVQDVDEVSWARRRVTVKMWDKEVRFAGARASDLYAALMALQDTEAPDGTMRPLAFEAFPAALHRGPLSSPGLMYATGRRVGFLLTGAFDQLTGLADHTEFPFEELTHLTVSGRIDKRMRLNTAKETYIFSMSPFELKHDQLLQVFATSARDSELEKNDAWDAQARELLARRIEPWKTRLENQALKRMVAGHGDRDENWSALVQAGPALLVSPRMGARSGWLFLTSSHLSWLPDHPGSGMKQVELSTVELLRADYSDNAANELRIRVGTALLRLIPSAGESFVESFWEDVERLRRIAMSHANVIESDDDDWDRRETYRVPLVEEFRPDVRITHEVEGQGAQPVNASLADISMGGCALVSHDDLTALSGLKVEIPYNSEVPKLDLEGRQTEPPDLSFWSEAKIVHIRSVGEEGYRFGLGFGGLDGEKREEAREVWMQFQREEAARKQWLMEEVEEQELAQNIAEQSQAVAREIVMEARRAAMEGDRGERSEVPDL